MTRDTVDFERYGAYALYNWEIFFHAPLMIACKLSQNQRFEEAMRWFHYIFDPTNTESPDVPQRYWITRPFFEQNSEDYRKQRIEVLLQNIDRTIPTSCGRGRTTRSSRISSPATGRSPIRRRW